MANKNPTRPHNIDQIITNILNPKKAQETQAQRNKRISKEVSDLLNN